MIKELLNKMKLFKKFCVAVFTGNMYTPYVREAMKRDEQIKKRQEEEKIKYAKGGVVEPFVEPLGEEVIEGLLKEMGLKKIIRSILDSKKERCIWCATPYNKTDKYCRECGSNLKRKKEV